MELNSASWKMSLQMAWLVPIRMNILYLNRRTERKTKDQKKAVGTLQWSQERTVPLLIWGTNSKGWEKIQLIFQTLFIAFFQVSDWNHRPSFWNLSEVFLVLWTSDFKHWKYLDSSPISCSFRILSQSNWWLQSHCNTDFLPWINTKHFLIRFLVLGTISSLSILLTGTLKY